MLFIIGGTLILTIFSMIAYFSMDFFGNSQPIIPSNELTIVTGSAEKTYDGTPLTESWWTIKTGALIAGDTIDVAMISSITTPGTIPNEIGVTIFNAQGRVVTGYYQITYELGSLIVHPRPLILETSSAEKMYDGMPLTNPTWRVVSGQPAPTHRIGAVMNATMTTPGTIENIVGITIYDENEQIVTQHYNITYDFGTLTVHPREITIQTQGAVKLYDGFSLINPEWSFYSGQLADNHWIYGVMNATITTPGTIDNAIGITIYDQNHQDVTQHYNIAFNIGTLRIIPRDITIQTQSAEKTYDGTALSNPNWTILSGQLAPSHRIETVVNAAITTPGSISNFAGITIYDQNNEVVTQFYAINYNFGTLTIHPIRLTIQTPSKDKIYDGTALSNPTWTIFSGQPAPNHRIEAVMGSSITTPGSIENRVGITIFDEDNEMVTEHYEIIFDFGTLTVQPLRLTIQTSSDEKFYDGISLSKPTWTLLSGQLFDTHRIESLMTSALVYPGMIQNIVGITILDQNNQVVTQYYDITYDFGWLKIHPITILIKSNSASKVYDGEPLISNEWEMVGTLIDGHELVVNVNSGLTDVGTILNQISAYAIDQQGTIVNAYYQFIYEPGTLTVKSSAYSSGSISRSSFPVSKEDVFQIFAGVSETFYFRDLSWGNYDGNGWSGGVPHDVMISTNPLRFASFALAESGRSVIPIQVDYLRNQLPYLLPYHAMNALLMADDIHVSGNTAGILDFDVIVYFYNGSDSIQLQNASLASEELAYRDYVYRNYLSLPDSTRAGMLVLATQNGLDPSSPTLITDVQSYISNAATYNLDFPTIPDGEDIALYFLEVSKEGICQHFATAGVLMYRAMGIPARYVTGYVGSAIANQWAMVTGDMAHAWVEIYLNGMGWIPIEVTGGGSGIGGGSGGESKIKISAMPMQVVEPYALGKTIFASDVAFFGFKDYEARGYTYSATFTGELSTIGKAESKIVSLVIYDETGQDVTRKFAITKLPGKLQLYTETIHLITSGASKVYDGTALTNDVWSIDGELLDGHYVATIRFSGKQTNVGTSTNNATIVILDEDGNDVTSIYQILPSFGDLSVTPKLLTIQSGSASKRYDGITLTAQTYDITAGSLNPTDVLEVLISGKQKFIGKSINTIASVIITSQGIDVTNNYTIVIIEGELIVTP